MRQLDIEGDRYARCVKAFPELPRRAFGCIAADPPWTFETRSDKGKGRSAEQHYGCMSFVDICALPVAELALKDAVLFLWVTDPMLFKARELIEAWGFTYKTIGFNWAKLNAGIDPDVPFHAGAFFTGMGYWSRANSELCLLATRGNPKRKHKDVRRLVVAQRREHSRKPDQAYDRMRRLVPGPYLELFARTGRPNWTSWGNEVQRFAAA